MNRIDKIKEKIEKIENLLAVIKSELEILSKEGETKPKNAHPKELLLAEERLRGEYEKLYDQFKVTNSKKIIEEFIKAKSKNYLKAFCKANNLPVDTTKVSKQGIAEEVFQWMKQRKLITEEAT
ncbi:MAG: hypothetical protein ACP5TY_04335 [Thermodesulforhabdaceae bacterium]